MAEERKAKKIREWILFFTVPKSIAIAPEQAAQTGRPQHLIYAGGVGTGFTEATLNKLLTLLTPLRRETNPFSTKPPKPNAIFVEPKLVCEVEFTEWTQGHTLRHPAFKGLRMDKEAAEVVRESLTD